MRTVLQQRSDHKSNGRLSRSIHVALSFVVLAIIVTAFSASGVGQTHNPSNEQSAERNTTDASDDVTLSPISGPIDNLRRHFRLRAPAKLDADEAGRIYAIINGALAAGYAAAEYPPVARYQTLKKFNTAPYLSATHGNHYLNNYANDIAKDYGLYEGAGTFPEGSVIAKDSFSVTKTREILLGPLYVMIKMAPGFNELTGDWKYVQIQPDGLLLGETDGEGGERVQYCIACHLAKAEQDHLYFVPAAYRLTPLG